MASNAPKNGRRSERKSPAKPAASASRTQSTSKAPTLGSPAASVEAKPIELSRQSVAEAAYYLWLQRGGSSTSNWLEAESALKRRLTATQKNGS